MIRRVSLLVGVAAVIGVNSSAAATEPTVAQINAAIVAHSNNFVLANSYGLIGHAPGHGWIDAETGA
jgi:hypothetical protein